LSSEAVELFGNLRRQFLPREMHGDLKPALCLNKYQL
jgi:hypothetical protein